MGNPSVEPTLRRVFESVLLETNSTLKVPLDSNTVLLQSGLDSLGFAILVSRLEEELGYDPYLHMKEARYPRTWGEFVSDYDKGRPA